MSSDLYISRTLVQDKGTKDARPISEAEIASLQAPIVLLGEPGIGKSDLAKKVAETMGATLLPAATFVRTFDASSLVSAGARIVIDGVDEITSTLGGSAVDEVLRKLSQIGRPRFLLSCRAADWDGAADRHRIMSDYGEKPAVLHLEPFSREQALAALHARFPEVNGDEVIDHLQSHGLDELVGNPLTIRLIGEVASEDEGLPRTKAELFARACALLTTERNPAHMGRSRSRIPTDGLLSSAGAIFAHVLITGSIGVSQTVEPVDGYVSVGDLVGLPDASQIERALNTRLFQSAGESLFAPIHRVVAEYLGAAWIASRIANGASRRRILSMLSFRGGVPTSLRGLHAWLAYLSVGAAPSCIRNDPYGVLRYGDPAQLSDGLARMLLSSLSHLSQEDPYFRSEDWGRSAASGLVRPELRDDIVQLIASPEQHSHLSSLLLDSMAGSALANEIIPELTDIMLGDASMASRNNACDALLTSSASINWVGLARRLSKRGHHDRELALHIATKLQERDFPPDDTAKIYLRYAGILDAKGKREGRASSHSWTLTYYIPSRLAAQVLDAICAQLDKLKATNPDWEIRYDLSNLMRRLISKALSELEELVKPSRLFKWIKNLGGREYGAKDESKAIAEYFRTHDAIRRSVQWLFLNSRTEKSAWTNVAFHLPNVGLGLRMNEGDSAHFLQKIAQKKSLSDFDLELARSLLHIWRSENGWPDEIEAIIPWAAERHPGLALQVEDLRKPPPTPSWEIEQRQRTRREAAAQRKKFEKHRSQYTEKLENLKTANPPNLLARPAEAYLNHFHDLPGEMKPQDRLAYWLGDDIASAALVGFAAALEVENLPTAEQIAQSHAESRQWVVEPVMKAGALEWLAKGKDLTRLSWDRRAAILAAWWEFPELEEKQSGTDLAAYIEPELFKRDEDVERFLRFAIEPKLAANQTHVQGLYRLQRDDAFGAVAGKLSIEWLRRFPNVGFSTEHELLQIAIKRGSRTQLKEIVLDRAARQTDNDDQRRMWHAASFVLGAASENLQQLAHTDKQLLWSVRDLMQSLSDVGANKLAAVVESFAPEWPPAEMPGSSWGGDNPWNAAEFLARCLDTLATLPTAEASNELERLSNGAAGPYTERAKHCRTQQLKLRRDKEYRAPTVGDTKAVFESSLPKSIDDLQALVLDRLSDVQNYIRGSETDAWETFWSGDGPKTENRCRDRLIDLLRAGMPTEVQLLPESLMPGSKRSDILALIGELGVPLELKGQWNKELWVAAVAQLRDKYTSSWRASGRGIYLVLWFGRVPKKGLRKHPAGNTRPKTPDELAAQLIAQLSPEERSRIDVIVLDVSKPG